MIQTNTLSVLGLLCALTAGSCSESKNDEAAHAGEVQRREATRVRTTALARREMTSSLRHTTPVVSQNEIELFPRVAGIVMEILVEEGDRVEKDQVLAILDQREADVAVEDAAIALREAQAQLPEKQLAKREAEVALQRSLLTWEQATRAFDRVDKAGLVSKDELDMKRLTRDQGKSDHEAANLALDRAAHGEKAANTAIDRAKLTLEREQLNFSYTQITAPFAGVIATRSIRIGDSVGSAASAFLLSDTDHLRAIFYRPQRELPLFRKGLAPSSEGGEGGEGGIDIRVIAEAIPGTEFSGHIELISPTIDAASGGFRITVSIEQPDETHANERLLPGMLVDLFVVTDRHVNALVVPKRALQREGEVNFLYVVKDAVAIRVIVTEGFSDPDFVEVIPVKEGALSEGDEIVVVGNRDLEQDSEVTTEAWVPLRFGPPDPEEEEAEPSEAEPEPEEETDKDADEASTEGDEETATDADESH
jgi:membrane fusion protein, multidrug efflux system